MKYLVNTVIADEIKELVHKYGDVLHRYGMCRNIQQIIIKHLDHHIRFQARWIDRTSSYLIIKLSTEDDLKCIDVSYHYPPTEQIERYYEIIDNSLNTIVDSSVMPEDIKIKFISLAIQLFNLEDTGLTKRAK